MADRYFRAPGGDDEEEDEEELVEEVEEATGDGLFDIIDIDVEEKIEGFVGEGTLDAPLQLEEDKPPEAAKVWVAPQPLARQLNLDADRCAQMVSMFRPTEAEPAEQVRAVGPLTSHPAFDLVSEAQTFVSTGPVAALPKPPRDLAKAQRTRLTRPSKSAMYAAVKIATGDKLKNLQDWPNVLLSCSFRVGWGPNGQLVMPSFVRFRTCLPDPEATRASGSEGEVEYAEPCTLKMFRLSATMCADLNHVREQYRPMLEALRKHTVFRPDTPALTSTTAVCQWEGTVENGQTIRSAAQREMLTALLADYKAASVAELECHRGYTRRTMSGIALAHPFPLSNLHDVALRHGVDVWSLLNSLWSDDTPKEEPPPSHSPASQRIYERLRQRRQFERWLVQTVAPRVDADLRVAANTTEPLSRAALQIFLLLTGHRIPEAMNIAIEAGNLRLAMILSTYDTVGPASPDLQKQLQFWQEQGSAPLINTQLYNVYRLLAGDLAVLQETLGDMYDWQRSLGCFLWYSHRNPLASVEECVKEYLSRGAAKLTRPWPTCPPYIQELPLIREREDVVDGSPEEFLLRRMHYNAHGAEDLGYLLLAAQFDPKRRESPALLSPLTHTYCNIDFRILGPLLVVLCGLGMGPSSYGAIQSVISDWAAQLEMEGLWHEALFALLHLPPTLEYPHLREAALKAVLRRHIGRLQEARHEGPPRSRRALRREVRLPEWTKEFLSEQLRLPSTWVEEALEDYRESHNKASGGGGGGAVVVSSSTSEEDQPLDTLANYCEMLKLVEGHLRALSHAA